LRKVNEVSLAGGPAVEAGKKEGEKEKEHFFKSLNGPARLAKASGLLAGLR
jgi:hypothetical protein